MSLTTQTTSSIALIGTLLSLTGLAGCGGGGGPLSRPEFIERANAICTRAAAEERSLVPPTFRSLPLANRSTYVESVQVKSIEKELRRLKAISPPLGDGKQIQAIWKQTEKGLKDAKLDPLDPLVKETDPFARANRLARRYGLEACSKSSHAVIRPGTFAQLYETGK